MTNKKRVKKLERETAPISQVVFTETGVETGIFRGMDRALYSRAEVDKLAEDPAINVVIMTLRYEEGAI
jgi:hypothetical protein